MQSIAARFDAPRKSSLAAVLALFFLAGPVAAQELAPPQQQLDPETQALLQEFQEIQQRVGEVQDQALIENEELGAREAELGEMVNAAMTEVDPEAPAKIERMEELEEEAMLAQQQQDTEALQQLMAEAQQIGGELQMAQQQALQREDVQAEIQQFQDDLIAEMTTIEPEMDALLDRMDEISQLLMAGGPPL